MQPDYYQDFDVKDVLDIYIGFDDDTFDLIDFLKKFNPQSLIEACKFNIAKYKIRLGKKRSIAKDIMGDFLRETWTEVSSNVEEDKRSELKGYLEVKARELIAKYDAIQKEKDKDKLNVYSQTLKELRNV